MRSLFDCCIASLSNPPFVRVRTCFPGLSFCIPNQYVNHDTLTCTIKRTVVTGTYRCQAPQWQSITLTATAENDNDYSDAPCKDADGRV